MNSRQNNASIVDIAFCMGSSCFSRGSNHGLTQVQDYIKTHGLEHRIHLRGHLCQGQCQEGPNIMINGEAHPGVDASVVLDLVKHHLQSQNQGDNQ